MRRTLPYGFPSVNPFTEETNVRMDKIITTIKARIEECKISGSMFTMPVVDGGMVEERDLPTYGVSLSHVEYVLRLSDGRSICIDYQSKDRSHSFRVEPDRSCIRVTCSDHSNDFSDSWDEKC